MRSLLQLIALLLTLYFLITVLPLLQYWARGGFREQLAQGPMGVAGICGILAALFITPAAALTLFRLQRLGLYLTATLFALALAYSLALVVAGQNDETTVPRMIFYVATIAFFLSPSARRTCPK